MPAIRRAIKKFVYAASALGMLALLIALIILPRLDLFSSKPEPVPEVRESILVESLDVVDHNGSIDIVARVRNPNPRHGVPQYTVTFTLLDKDDNELEVVSAQTYLLPGSLNYIAALDIPVPANYASVKATAPYEPTFAATPRAVTTPTFNSFLRSRDQRRIGGSFYEIQKGIVINTSTLGFKKIDVTGVALDKTGRVVGVSQTFTGELKSGEQREFTLQWPLPKSETERVLVLPATNIYLPDNVLPAEGDPASLR